MQSNAPIAALLCVVVGSVHLVTTAAAESAAVISAEGRLDRSLTNYATPVPICFIHWEHTPQEGTEFDAVLRDYFFNNEICQCKFTVHCGTDTLAFAGGWPYIDISGWDSMRNMWLDVSLAADLLVTAATTLTATRQWAGDLECQTHEVTLVDAAGDSISLLPADGAQDEVQVVLQPAVYGVRIHVHAAAHPHEVGAYDGAVSVTWTETASAVVGTTWGSVKSLYR